MCEAGSFCHIDSSDSLYLLLWFDQKRQLNKSKYSCKNFMAQKGTNITTIQSLSVNDICQVWQAKGEV